MKTVGLGEVLKLRLSTRVVFLAITAVE